MIFDEEEYLMHYGTKRHSRRYPWGSGEEPESTQRQRSFLNYVADLRKKGLSETDIARGLDISTTELRAKKSIARAETKAADIAMAQRLKDGGWGPTAIGKQMGIGESTVRDLLAPGAKDKVDVIQSVASKLKDQVDANKGYVQIGTGVENYMGVSKERLAASVAVLQEKGYVVRTVQVDQLGTSAGKKTLVKVLAPPGTTYKDVVTNMEKIELINHFSEDGGRTLLGLKPPISISSDRLHVRYGEEGGGTADGVIYIRPGVNDVSLGNSRYAQVRVAVDGTHYLKGMAMYKDDLPPGVDLMFNTPKSDTGDKLDALKPMKQDEKTGKIDADNPFGSQIRRQVLDEKGDVSSSMNIIFEEGDWDTWSRNLSSQFLSKQSPLLAKTQLDMTYEREKSKLDEIMALTNPAVRKKLLEAYSDGADSSAVHLKAAALPRQSSHVILPVNSMKETEVYAPNFNNGERVVLIRHPHGGPFEIPELTVNNRHPEAKRLLGDTPDAIGINVKVAVRLSGADFDGDSVIVIPNDHNKVKTAPALEDLKGFDPVRAYPGYEGMKPISPDKKQTEMGVASNLITDMTIRGANNADLAKAVKHAMVIIDAEKHNLNWKQSAIDNSITHLKEKYQSGPKGGASTIVSRAGSRIDVPAFKPRSFKDGGPIDSITGRKMFEPKAPSFINKKGEEIVKTRRSVKLAETEDAHTLSSGTPIEKIYADHSNRMKALANIARRESVNTRGIPVSDSAKRHYAEEVASLNSKLNVAISNRPLERQAQIIGQATVKQKTQANPNMDYATKRKIEFQALEGARHRTGAYKQQIVITEREWQAIQAGAISNNRLKDILDNANIDVVKKLATPKTALAMTSSKTTRAKAMMKQGYTQAEVAAHLGVSLTTLKNSL